MSQSNTSATFDTQGGADAPLDNEFIPGYDGEFDDGIYFGQELELEGGESEDRGSQQHQQAAGEDSEEEEDEIDVGRSAQSGDLEGQDEGRAADDENEDEDEDEDSESQSELAALARRLEESDRRNAELAREMRELREWREGSRQEEYEREAAAHEAKGAEIKARLKKAIQDQDTEAHLAAYEELADHRSAKPKPPERRPAQESSQQQQQAPAAPPPKVQAYLSVNAWIGNERYGEMNQELQRLDMELQQAGVSPTSDKYYRQISAKLRSRFPREAHLVVDPTRPAGKTSRESPANRRNSPGARGGEGQPKEEQRRVGGRVRPKNGKYFTQRDLTGEDIATMRRFEMDPRNKKDLTNYLRYKVE